MRTEINQQKKALILIGSISSLIILLVGGFYVYKTWTSNTDIDQTNIVKDDYYSIRNNATDYQKELYAALKEAIETSPRNDLDVSALVAQNFVADFYTWTNKFRMNDVGGIQFIIESMQVNVYQSAQVNLYQDLYYYLNNGGLSGTLEVSDISVVSKEAIDFFVFDDEGAEEIYDEVTGRYRDGDYHDAIEVVLNWSYVSTNSFDASVYDQSATVILMMNEKNLPMVVEVTHE